MMSQDERNKLAKELGLGSSPIWSCNEIGRCSELAKVKADLECQTARLNIVREQRERYRQRTVELQANLADIKAKDLEQYNDLTTRTEIAEAENKRLRELLSMAHGQLKYIGCFAGCENGVLRNAITGEPEQCQCCDEQSKIEQALKGKEAKCPPENTEE